MSRAETSNRQPAAPGVHNGCRRRRRSARAWLATLALLGACRTTMAPKGFAPPEAVTMRTAVGAWVEVEAGTREAPMRPMGELVAVHADTLFLFHHDTLRAVPIDAVQSVKVARYSAPLSGVAWWGLAGILSTATHGFVLILSAPIWSVATIGTAAAISRRAIDITRDVGRLQPYARFPQGIPAGLDRRRLVPAVRPASGPVNR